MKSKRHLLKFFYVGSTVVAVALLALALTKSQPASARADNSNPPPFDFSDQFYGANGITPAAISERAGNPDRNPAHWKADSSNTDPNRRGIRILETTGGFDEGGKLIYYSIMGTVFPSTFTNDQAGAQAREIANAFRAFIFPKTPRNPDGSPGNVILSPAPSNRRQDNLFDTRNNYFDKDPLGLWILAFVVYTQKAFTPDGQKELAKIAPGNGTDLDGTPILNNAGVIDKLAEDGIVEIRTRPPDGTKGFPWVI